MNFANLISLTINRDKPTLKRIFVVLFGCTIMQMVLGRTTGEVAGWGLYSSLRLPSYEVRHAELPTVTRNRCWSSYQGTAQQLRFALPPRLMLTENMFCGGFE